MNNDLDIDVLGSETVVEEQLSEQYGPASPPDEKDEEAKKRAKEREESVSRISNQAGITDKDPSVIRHQKLKESFDAKLAAQNYNPEGKPLEPTTDEFEVIPFANVEEWKVRTSTVLQPVDKYWEKDSEFKTGLITKFNGDEEAAKDAFTAQYEEYVQEQLKSDKVTNLVSMMRYLDIQLGNPDWSLPMDPDFLVMTKPMTASKAVTRMFGFNQPSRSWEEASTTRDDFDYGYYSEDSEGNIEWVPLSEDHTMSRYFEDDDRSVINNPKFTNDQGKTIVAFQYLGIDNYTRLKHFGPTALYEGTRPMGEIVSDWDLDDSFLRANGLTAGASMPFLSMTRSTIGLGVNLAAGAVSAARSVYSIAYGDEPTWGQDFITATKSFGVGKSQHDKNNLITFGNALDLVGDIFTQIALAYLTGGLSAVGLTAMGASSGVVLWGSRVITGLTYGMIAAEPIKDEAIKAGFTPRAASSLSLVFLASVGAIGATSNLLPGNLAKRLEKKGLEAGITEMRAFVGTASGALKNGTASPQAQLGFAHRLAQNIINLPTKAAVMIDKGGAAKYIGHGVEELGQEQFEFFVERGYKAGMNVLATPERMRDGVDPGFMTMDNPQYWNDAAAEFALVSVAGFMGGTMGAAIPFPGSGGGKKYRAMQSSSVSRLLRLTYEETHSPPKMAAQLKSKFLDTMDEMQASGALGSSIFTAETDPKTGRYKTVEEAPDSPSIALINKLAIMYDYHAFLELTRGYDGTYEEFIADEANADLVEALNDGGHQFEKLKELVEEKNALYGSVDPLAEVHAEEVSALEAKKDKGVKYLFKFGKKSKKESGTSTPEATEKQRKDKATADTKLDSKIVGGAAESEVKITTPAVGADAKEKNETEDTDAQEGSEKFEEGVRVFAEKTGIKKALARKLLTINSKIEDIVHGRTLEKDIIEYSIMSNPILKPLLPNEADLDYLDELTISDVDRLLQDDLEYEEIAVAIEEITKVTEAVNSIEGFQDILTRKNSDGQILITSKSKKKLEDTFKNLMVDVGNEPSGLKTAEGASIGKLNAALMEIAKKRGLYETAEKSSEAAVTLGKSWEVTVSEAVDAGKSEKKIEAIRKKFLKKNMKALIKTALSLSLHRVMTIKELQKFKIDVSTVSTKQAVEGVLYSDIVSDDFEDVLLDVHYEASISKVVGSDNVLVFQDALALFKETNRNLALWEDLSKNVLNTNIPSRRRDGSIDFLIRDFSTSKTKGTTTYPILLTNKNYLYDPSDPQKFPGRTLTASAEKGLLEMLASEVDETTGIKLLPDLQRAKDLLERLKVRRAQLGLITGEFAGDGSIKARTKFIESLARIRIFNAKVYSQEEYDAPLSMDAYTNFSKYFTSYIFDPVLYMQHHKGFLSETGLTFDAIQEYNLMNAKFALIFGKIIPNLDIAIRKAEELVSIAENSRSEETIKDSYKASVAKEITETFAISVYRLAGSLGNKTSLHKEAAGIISEDDTKTLMKFYYKLKDYAGRKLTDEEILDITDIKLEISKFLYELPMDVKKKIFAEIDRIGLVESNVLPFIMMVSNFEEFVKLSENIDVPNTPNHIQDVSIYQTYALMTSSSKEGDLKMGHNYGLYEYFIFLTGIQGTGKTKIAATSALKIAKKYWEIHAPTGKHKVLLVSNSKSQVATLVTLVRNANLDAITSIGNKRAINSKELFTFLQLTSTKSEQEAIAAAFNATKDITFLVYDEITQLQSESANESEGIAATKDLSILLKRINDINKLRAEASMPPITFTGIGDHKQGGWVTGNPAFSNGWVETKESSPARENMSVLFEHHRTLSTRELITSFRAYSGELRTAATGFVDVATINFGTRKLPLVVHGIDKEDTTQKWGGTEIVHNESEGVWNNQELVDELTKQLEADKDFTIGIIYDAAGNDKSKLPDGVLKELALNPEYKDRVVIELEITEVDRVVAEDHNGVQGSEFDYTIVVLKKGFLIPFGRTTNSNSYNYGLVGMMIGRGKYYARVFIPESVGISSTKKENIHLMADIFRNVSESEWAEFRGKMYGRRGSATTPETVTPEAPTPTPEAPPTNEPPKPEPPPPSPEGDPTVEPPVEPEPEPESEPEPKTDDFIEDAEIVVDAIAKNGDVESTTEQYLVPEHSVISSADLDEEVTLLYDKAGLDKSLTPSQAMKALDKMVADLEISKESADAIKAELDAILYVDEDEEVSTAKSTVEEEVTETFIGKTVPSQEEANERTRGQWSTKKRKGKHVKKLGTGAKRVRGFIAGIFDRARHTQAIAQDLADLGMSLAMSHTVTMQDQLSTPASIQLQYHYLKDVLGAYRMMPAEQILSHKKNAMGLGKSGKKMFDYYTYQLLVYEYTKSDVEYKKTAIVATYIGPSKNKGKSFFLGIFADEEILKNSKGTLIEKFITARHSELQEAVDEFQKNDEGSTASDASLLEFREFEKAHPSATAAMNSVSGTAITKATTNKAGSSRIRDGIITGLVHISYDVTEAVRTKNLFETHSLGELVTAPGAKGDENGAALMLETMRGKPGEYSSKINKPAGFKYPLSPAFDDYIESIKEIRTKEDLEAAIGKKSVLTVELEIDGKPEYFNLLPFKSADAGVPIYIALNTRTMESKAIFGIHDGQFIEDPNVSADVIYYDYQTESIINAIKGNKFFKERTLWSRLFADLSSDANVGVVDGTINASPEEAGEYLAKVYKYNLADLETKRSVYSKFKFVSKNIINRITSTVGDMPVTYEEATAMIHKLYRIAGYPGALQISKPLGFTATRFKGRPFLLYTHNVKHDLSTAAGITKIMNNLNKFGEKATKSGKIKLPSQLDAVQMLQLRDGIGVILLDMNPQTFSELNDIYTGAAPKEKETLKLGVASVNSKTTTRLISFIAQLGEMFQVELNHILDEDSSTRFKLLLERIYDPSDATLSPVIDTKRAEGFVKTIRSYFSMGIGKSVKDQPVETVAALRLVNFLASVLRNNSMGHLLTDGEDTVEGVDGIVKRRLKKSKYTGKPTLIKRNNVITFFPQSLVEPSEEAAAKGEVNPLGEDRIGFNILNLFEIIRGSFGDESVPSENVISLIFNMMDEVLLDYTLPGTLNRGLYAGPIIKKRSGPALWGELDEKQLIKLRMTTTIKGVMEPSIIVNAAELGDAILTSRRPKGNSPTTIAFNTYKKDIDKAIMKASTEITVLTSDKDNSRIMGELLDKLAFLEATHITKLSSAQLAYGGTSLKTLKEMLAQKSVTIAPIVVEPDVPLTDLEARTNTFEPILDLLSIDNSAHNRVRMLLSDLTIAITGEQIAVLENNLMDVFSTIEKTKDAMAASKLIMLRIKALKDLDPLILGARETIEGIIKRADEGADVYVLTDELKQVVKQVSNYEINLSERDKILKAYLASDEQGRVLLESALFLNTMEQSSLKSGYMQARLFVTLLSDPTTSYKDLSIIYETLKKDYPQEVARLNELPSIMESYNKREDEVQLATDYHQNIFTIMNSSTESEVEKIAVLNKILTIAKADKVLKADGDLNSVVAAILSKIDQLEVSLENISVPLLIETLINNTEFTKLDAVDQSSIEQSLDILENKLSDDEGFVNMKTTIRTNTGSIEGSIEDESILNFYGTAESILLENGVDEQAIELFSNLMLAIVPDPC